MNETKRGALKYIGILGIQRLIGAALFFGAAGSLAIARGWIYFTVYIAVSVFSCIMMFRSNADLLNRRRTVQEGTMSWDKALLAVYVVLAYFGIYAGAGLGIRLQFFQPTNGMFITGLILMAVSSVFAVWPIMENRHFESSVRIQNDRGHQVCTTGPYAFVRHPGYAAIILWCISMPMMFGHPVWVIALIMAVIIIIRTALEDQALQEKLPGYREYTQKVRYRLIPFLW